MRDTLKLVRGSVSTKDFVPVLKCFHLYNGRIQGQNGRIAIDAPFASLGITDFTVPAERFLKAIDACDSEPDISITDSGKLSVKRKGFRATLPLGEHSAFPLAIKSGELLATGGRFISTLRELKPFISDDASRPWTNGVLLSEGYAYATNNVVLVRSPFAWDFGDINLPVYAIDELLRIGIEPDEILLDENALTFVLGEAWLRAQLLTGEWPDVAARFEDIEFGDVVPSGIIQAIEKILPFCPDPKMPEIIFSAEGVSTAAGEQMAAIEGISLPDGCYRAEVLLLALSVAQRVNFAAYPAPVAFCGNKVEGMFVGLRK
jgi:DNA polymerase III sliding clamp (beta) subunit (PCNA family)